MIIGFSHITLSSDNLYRDVERISDFDFSRKFIEEGLVNASAKTPFLECSAGAMSLAYTVAPGSMGVEFVNYEQWAEKSAGTYEILLATPTLPAGAIRINTNPDWIKVAPELRDSDLFAYDGVHSVTFCCVPDSTSRVLAIKCRTRDVSKESAFWCSCFGCRLGGRDSKPEASWAGVQFGSIIPQWQSRIVFVKDTSNLPLPTMDARGCTCVSVVVKAVGEVLEQACGYGALAVSKSFEICVDGKSLDVGIVRTPGGAIVELLEYKASA